MQVQRLVHFGCGVISLLATVRFAAAVDLTVTSIEVNQADQFGTTKLFGNNITWIRVKIGISGTASAVAGVDASLQMSVDGVLVTVPPVFSLNGPITAPISPSSQNINDTINFAVLPPVSGNVDFLVEVNPGHVVAETNFANNTLAVNDKNFECRKVMEVAYVPVNYTVNGAGLPPANLIEPGIGDGFLRGIYHPGEWNYHKSPFPPLTWDQNINGSNNTLLNTLHDIRVNQLPAAGFPQPDFVYAWLPGNPYSGNGQAIDIPGDVAFGNTDPARFQRTFAHELGHCFGLQHNNVSINTVGVDTEHHLQDTQDLPQLFPPNKLDVMVAGQLTSAAWVAQNTYNVVHNDARMQCSSLAGDDPEIPVLRVSGVLDQTTGALQFDPVTRIDRGAPTPNDPNGAIAIIALDAAGNELFTVKVRTGATRELCSEHAFEKPVLDPHSGLYALLPETINGQPIHQIKIIDVASGAIMGSRERSPNAPTVKITAVQPAMQALDNPFPQLVKGHLRVQWSAADADGDPLTHSLLYSRDGGLSWLPVVLNRSEQSFEFEANDLPESVGNSGKFRVRTTDGLNVSEDDSPLFAMDAPHVPETFLITPNNDDVFPQHAPIAFHAASWDFEDLMLTGDKIDWTSSIDGDIGTGQIFINSGLSPGVHTITVTGTDSAGWPTSKSVSITITPRVVIDPDCNGNGILDSADIANGSSSDANGNGIPDECESQCPADVTADNIVNTADLLAVINAWGPCAACAADVNGDGAVNTADLLAVINGWGPCL